MTEILLGILIITTIILVVVLLMTKKDLAQIKALSEQNPLQQMIGQSIQNVHHRLDQTHQQMSATLTNLGSMMGNVGKELGGVREIGNQISKFQDFLNSPKLRGNLGEQILYDSLNKLLPSENYSTQYKFKNGSIVDALIITENGNIPIDSKFPMEVYQRVVNEQADMSQKATKGDFERAVKKYIDDIATKYINTEEHTVDFAFMYVPAESVYYEIVHGDYSILQAAMDRKVVIVSPHLFYHVLRVVLIGLERSKITKEVEQVWAALTGVMQEFGKFGKQIELVGKHLLNAKNAVDAITQDYTKFEQKLDNIKRLR